MRTGVLFVDDESLLRELYQTLSDDLRPYYDIYTAPTGEDALNVLQHNPVDVVVTDLEMPGMNGLQLLGRVANAQPDCCRIIISGYGDRLKIARSLFVGHRYFGKPCDLKDLKTLLMRLASFREVITNRKVRRVIGGLGSLPGPPEVLIKLEKILSCPIASVDEVSALIEQSPALMAKLLQIVNSAQFGLGRKVCGAADAVAMLGLGSVRALVVGVQAFSSYNGQTGKKAPPAELWEHSLSVASRARAIGRAQRFSPESCERAFFAGLLHDVGKVIINANAPDDMTDILDLAQKFRTPMPEAEMRRFGVTYAEIGAYLLALWGIDDEVTSMVRYQEKLEQFDGADKAALACLHVAHSSEAKSPVAYPLRVEGLTALGYPEAESWLGETD